ncbi:Bifunctional protein pyrR Pyrimidine operon regulatory protein Uracil phosphoribosyltransferase (UPRTase) [Alteracholeplasma palmae J233]|uniref:Bifunctional protein PyrR n=1 Tax=Alteracholeplasma palmae (strain ATCC 49389 / J233) TaxID=1318466 RepID=U4KQN1_ALTPJ|nr:bifunctional pyr operon transcriptional regulator/uracil phosphoribosyltransferase PyrR [Alteracholeplasma palmae]CCV64870.1 Bifunctional protein pyrR Pyrimidine operon regulatory protein Uracil phosphoribosyltransferase (UPRTase) [Alteracholeplasma palmae J233]
MKEILNSEQLSRTLKRMTHEIIERNNDLEEIVLVGIMKKGLPIAEIIKENLKRFADVDITVFGIDITAYRDDMTDVITNKEKLEVANKNVILVDDVLFTGRSVRAAMDALVDMARPSKVQLAVLVDRGHRELPIRADYVGKNIPTSKEEKVIVDFNNQCVYLD